MNKIVLAICSWDNFKSDTVFNLLSLATSGHFCNFVTVNGSLIPLARNKIIAEIITNTPDFTHIFFVDADMTGITDEMVVDLIAADKSIIGPVCTFRGPPFQPTVSSIDFNNLLDQFRKKEQNDREIIEVSRTGLGCLLVKREIIDCITETCENGGKLWFSMDRPPRKQFFEEASKELDRLKTIEFENEEDLTEKVFQSALKLGVHCRIGAEFIGEDYNFCEIARRQGYKIFLHTKHCINHIGDCAYNLGDWLKYLEAVQNKDPDLMCRLMQKTLAWDYQKKGVSTGTVKSC